MGTNCLAGQVNNKKASAIDGYSFQSEIRRLVDTMFIDRKLLGHTKVEDIAEVLVHLEEGPSLATPQKRACPSKRSS